MNCRVILFILLSLLTIAAAKNYVVCFTYDALKTDIGYTFYLNDVRRTLHKNLLGNFTNQTFSSYYMEHFASMASNTTNVLVSFVKKHACNIVFVNTHFSLSQYHFDFAVLAEHHPQCLFVFGGYPPSSFAHHQNISFAAVDTKEIWYQIGLIAGVQSTECVGIIVPSGQPWMPINAMHLGMLASGSSSRLAILPVEQNPSVELEKTAAQLLIEHGCDVIAHWTDSLLVDTYVASLYNSSATSIGFGTNANLYAGDTVLTQMLFLPHDIYFNITKALILNETRESLQFFGWKDGVLAAPEVSARASDEIRNAAEFARIQALTNTSIFCVEQLKNATAHAGCPTQVDSVKIAFSLLDDLVPFPLLEPKETCPPGFSYSYTVLGTIKLNCTRCPEGTFSDMAGSLECRACPSWTHPRDNNSGCTAFPWWVVFILVAAVIALLSGVVYLGLLCTTPKSVSPPLGPDLALGIVGIDQKRSRLWRQSFLAVCELINEIVRAAAEAHGVYISATVGDVCFVAAETIETLLCFAGTLQQEAASRNWPQSVSLKFVIHSGRPTPSDMKHGESELIEYTGTDAEIVIQMFKAAEGGSVWCSSDSIAQNTHLLMEFGTTSTFQLKNESQKKMVEVAKFEGPKANPLFLYQMDFEVPEQQPASPCVPPSGNSTIDLEASIPGDAHPADELVQLTLSLALSAKEVDIARDFVFLALMKFVQVLPVEEEMDIVFKACRRLQISLPEISTDRSTFKKEVRVSLRRLALHLLRQMEALELRHLLDRWAGAHQEGAAHADQQLWQSTTDDISTK